VKLKKQKRVIVGLVVAILAALLLSCDSEVDVTPPVISEIMVSNIAENSATITWSTDEPTRGYLRYGCSFDGMSLLSFKYSDESTFHIVVLDELRPDEHYWFEVTATDASWNTATAEEGSFRTTEVPVSTWAVRLECYRDPEFALQHGWFGYLDITWLDDPGDLCLDRGEEWCGTWLLHFVSHTSELTEMSLYVSRCDGLWNYPRWCIDGDGPAEPIKFFPLWWYEPHGVIRMKAGETVPVKVTVRIPEDLPEEIHQFTLEPQSGLPGFDNFAQPEEVWTDDPVMLIPSVARTVHTDCARVCVDPLLLAIIENIGTMSWVDHDVVSPLMEISTGPVTVPIEGEGDC